MFPRCDSDQADKRNVIYLTPVTAPFKDANRLKIYLKFAEQEVRGEKQPWRIKMFEACLKLDGQKV